MGHGQGRRWRALETLLGPVSRVWGQKAALRESKVSQRTGSERVWGVLLWGHRELVAHGPVVSGELEGLAGL